MKTKKHWAYTGGAVTVAVTVPAGTKSDHIVKIGNAGLYGIAQTDQATPDMVKKGQAPQGLVDNQASVFFPGIVLTVAAPAADLAAIPDGAKVDWDGTTKKYVAAAGATFVGYRLNATTVALRSN